MLIRKDLDLILNSKPFRPGKLIAFLESDYNDLYKADIGVFEGYTLKEHTLMVMNQFEKYYGDKKLPASIGRDFFRLLLALHDIGKPDAIKSGDKNRQHEFTIKITRPIFDGLGFNKNDWQLFKTIINEDYLGAFTRDGNIDTAIKKITTAGKETNLSLKDFFTILEIYYKVDAGSYTEDAGGQKSMDYLFDFDHKNNNLNFSQNLQVKFDLLKNRLI